MPPRNNGELWIHQTNFGKSQTESLVKEHRRPLSMAGGKLGRALIELSNFELHYSRLEIPITVCFYEIIPFL